MIRNSLKFVVIMAVVLLTVTSAAVAVVPLKLGVKGGISIADLRGDDAGGAKGKSGIVFGVFTNIGLVKGWSLQPELLYVQKGTNGTFRNDLQVAETTLKANYIEVPILLKRTFRVRGPVAPSVFFGPALAFLQSSKTELSDRIYQFPASVDVDNYKEKSTDVGLVVGLGLDFKMSRTTLFLDARYTYGLSSMWEDVDVESAPDDEIQYYDPITGEADDMKNSTLAFMVGMMI